MDTSVALVALPSMTDDPGASQDTITWVLTSSVVAFAILTPATGWLPDRSGTPEAFLISIIGFVAIPIGCGLAWTLPLMVMFRLIQGVSGRAIVPMWQAFLLDINPREKAGQAMAMWEPGSWSAPSTGRPWAGDG